MVTLVFENPGPSVSEDRIIDVPDEDYQAFKRVEAEYEQWLSRLEGLAEAKLTSLHETQRPPAPRT